MLILYKFLGHFRRYYPSVIVVCTSAALVESSPEQLGTTTFIYCLYNKQNYISMGYFVQLLSDLLPKVILTISFSLDLREEHV